MGKKVKRGASFQMGSDDGKEQKLVETSMFNKNLLKTQKFADDPLLDLLDDDQIF